MCLQFLRPIEEHIVWCLWIDIRHLCFFFLLYLYFHLVINRVGGIEYPICSITSFFVQLLFTLVILGISKSLILKLYSNRVMMSIIIEDRPHGYTFAL